MLLRESDVIKCVRPIPGVDSVGMVLQVVKLTNDGVIVVENSTGIGVMDYNSFVLFFEKIEAPPCTEAKVQKRQWSDWVRYLHPQLGYLMFRENGRRLEIKRPNGGIKAHACCHPKDTFDEDKGIELAAARLRVKELQRAVAEIKAAM